MGVEKSSSTESLNKCKPRTSLLKSCIYHKIFGKPDTTTEPLRKSKSVVFADTIGKPLKSVKTVQSEEDAFAFHMQTLNLRNEKRPFTLRRSQSNNIFFFKASDDRTASTKAENINRGQLNLGRLVNFKQPVTRPDFADRIRRQKLCLENVVFGEYGLFATAAVQNVAFEKCVTAEYTLDNWKSSDSIRATYVQASSIGTIDMFSFEIPIPEEKRLKDTQIQLVLSYTAAGETFWDNNNGNNYCIDVFRKSTDKTRKNMAKTGFKLSNNSFVGWST